MKTDLIDPEIAGQGGRIVKTTGDGMLAEFVSVGARGAVCDQHPDGDGGA
jgi:class 3 adenylate cyclase